MDIFFVAGVSVTFGLLAWGGITLTRDAGRIAIIWLPNAFLVAVLLRGQFNRNLCCMAGAFAANIAVNLMVGDVLPHAAYLSFCNQVEVALVWLIMRRAGLDKPDLRKFRDLKYFIVAGGIIAPSVSATFAAIYLSGGDPNALLPIWIKWAARDGLGMLLLAPAILVVADAIKARNRAGHSLRTIKATRKLPEWLIIQGFIFCSATLIFAILDFPILFLIAPLIILAAFRLRAWGTSAAIIQITVIVVVCASLKLGPFYALDISLTMKLFILQIFLLSCFAIGLPISAVLSAKDVMTTELRSHQDMSNSMLANMREVIFRTDCGGRWVFLNPAWKALTGFHVQQGLGRCMSEAVLPDDIPILHEHFDKIRTGVSIDRQFEVRMRHRSGDNIAVELSLSALHGSSGEIVGAIGNIRDVSERKAMETRLRSARAHAEAAVHAKSRFLANMSHEIRTPMNGVLGFAQILLQDDLTPQQRQHMEMIFESGNAMMQLLNDILDISKIETGQMKTRLEPLDPRHVLQSCIKLMQPTADQKSLHLTLEIDEAVPEKLIGDKYQLRQIILNLLGNAIKFTDSGSVTMCAKKCPSSEDSDNIVIQVHDTGIGIASDKLESIFQAFEQAEDDTARRFGGTGLGLTISRQLARNIGGDIKAESRAGQGTAFTLTFPQIPNKEHLTAETKNMEIELLGKPLPIANTDDEQPARAGRILLVEDHDVNQMLITAMTERLGYTTELATDGAEAVEMVDAAIHNQNPYDLVLMDVQMPIMDGYQATRMIRASGITPQQLPIVAITANAFSDDIESCHAVGMQAHISKPVMIDKLKSALEQWLASDEPVETQPGNIELPSDLLTGELGARYRQRKEEALHCLTSLVRRATFQDPELKEAASHLHKLAGTAAMFGDGDLGIQAKMIENGITQWSVSERPSKLKNAVCEFLKAA